MGKKPKKAQKKRGVLKPGVRVFPTGETWELVCTFNTQAQAWTAAVGIAKAFKCEAQLSGTDGMIRKKDSYGHDPRKVRG